MKSINLRLILLLAFCGVAALSVLWLPAGQDHVLALESDTDTPQGSLTIGSAAPKLDIEHWIQDGNGFFQPVSEFEPGKVYVVEFWATWCPPCVASMPHLAELQNRYRGQNVQIISISDEPLKTVETFLKRETEGPDGETTTFHEITAAYSLTTDPDRSAHEGYMEASQQQNIPTAFIVGKQGKIEWIGHPMEIDEPLEQVVQGVWDREEFAELYVAKRSFPELIQKLSQLANRGELAAAVDVVEAELKKKQPKEIEAQLRSIKQQLKVMGGMIDDEVSAHFQQQLDASKGNPVGVASIAASLYQAAQAQDDAAAPQPGLHALIHKTIKALEQEVAGADQDLQPLLYDTLARLQQTVGDLDAAIAAQQSAVDSASGPTKDRLKRFLQELKEAKGSDADADDAEDADQADDAAEN